MAATIATWTLTWKASSTGVGKKIDIEHVQVSRGDTKVPNFTQSGALLAPGGPFQVARIKGFWEENALMFCSKTALEVRSPN